VWLIGLQGRGKTRWLVGILLQIGRARPRVRLFIIDPKGELAAYSQLLNATVVDVSDLSLDMSSPLPGDRARYAHELVPQVGNDVHLDQGIELMHEAVDIVLPQLEIARRATGQGFEPCWRDVRLALPMVCDASDYKRVGYMQSAQTALHRGEYGSRNLFVCRRGADLHRLFDENVIVTARGLTDERACRMFSTSLLYWLQTEAQRRPVTDHMERLLVIDDANRFIGADRSSSLTSLTHELTLLRTTGSGWMFSAHIPSAIEAAILSLAHFCIVVGGVIGGEDRRIVARLLGLNPQQELSLGRMAKREALGFYADGAWRRVVHGLTPDVPDPNPDWEAIEARSKKFVAGLGIILPWRNLWEYRERIVAQEPAAPEPVAAPADAPAAGTGLSDTASRLLYDVTTYLFDFYTTRLERLGLSAREGGAVRRFLEQEGYAQSIFVGPALFLVAIDKGYRAVGRAPRRVRAGIPLNTGSCAPWLVTSFRRTALLSASKSRGPSTIRAQRLTLWYIAGTVPLKRTRSQSRQAISPGMPSNVVELGFRGLSSCAGTTPSGRRSSRGSRAPGFRLI
jgi:hypothetical protein